MGIFLAKLGELVPRALPTHVSKNIEANQARAPNSLCVAWCLPGQYLLSLRKRASMELIFPAILSWLLFGRKFVLLVRGSLVEGAAWDSAATGGDNPSASDSIPRGGESEGFATNQNQNILDGALMTKKQTRFSQPILLGSVVAPSPSYSRGLRRSHTSCP